jgi:hypothetical protein
MWQVTLKGCHHASHPGKIYPHRLNNKNTVAPFLFVSPCTCGCDSMMIYGSEQLLWLWSYICCKITLFCHIICGLDFNIPTVHESLNYHFGTRKSGFLIFFTLAKCSNFLQGICSSLIVGTEQSE